MLNRFTRVNQTSWYWPALIILGLFSVGLALFYQYVLEYRPCVLCIHVRLWILLYILVAIFAVLLGNSTKLVALAHGLNTAIMAILLERSYMLLGTERGWVFGSCDFDLGFPAWFDLEQWFPSLFKVWEPCGYTPILIFGITMAEALFVIYLGLLVVSALLTIAAFRNLRSN